MRSAIQFAVLMTALDLLLFVLNQALELAENIRWLLNR